MRWSEYGLSYAKSVQKRRFADPCCAVACLQSDRLFGLDSQAHGLIQLDPSGDVSVHFPDHRIGSAAAWTADACILVVEGRLVRGAFRSGLSVLRNRSSAGEAYKLVSTDPESQTIAALDADGAIELLTAKGELLWRARDSALARDAVAIMNPGDKSICVVYERANILRWHDSAGAVIRQVGRPGAKYVPEGLFAPKGSAPSRRGVLIADSYNNRVVCVGSDGEAVWSYGDTDVAGSVDGLLWRPVASAENARGQTLIADSKNGRFVLIDSDHRLRQVWGDAPVERTRLRLPRSVMRLDDSRLIVADTHNDRLVQLTDGADAPITLGGVEPGHAWPRCAITLHDRLWVSEGRSSEIRIGAQAFRSFPLQGARNDEWALNDPHEIAQDPAGGIVVTDTGNDNVIALNDTLEAHPIFEPGALSDPHSACFTLDGAIAVADTGHDRLLIQPHQGGRRELRQTHRPNGEIIQLKGLRHCSIWNNHFLLTITDSNTVVLCDADGEVRWAFGPTRFNPEKTEHSYFFRESFLHGPKWACGLSPTQVAIGDTGNSRILILTPDLG